ncbi:hypothetical protein SAMN05443999_12110 [Roseovarius azorensis]|uniref:Uncharacterized protein n=1 Tax=Roseovarius azorensis TaxID=1287727 RepID=A0A1H7XIL3_9RHOB|nr:hypothetical protein [Roseovarius azorensis]SEM33732.1 hypothetical protein SAMN05443999_12110 [Roseovarius azorensis]
MKPSPYIRPVKTAAASIGERRMHWTRFLRKEALYRLPSAEFLAAEEGLASATRSRRGQNKAAWINTSLRIDQIAVVEVLQKLHLQNTGKEISRAEVLAALMAAGLGAVLARDEFSASR